MAFIPSPHFLRYALIAKVCGRGDSENFKSRLQSVG